MIEFTLESSRAFVETVLPRAPQATAASWRFGFKGIAGGRTVCLPNQLLHAEYWIDLDVDEPHQGADVVSEWTRTNTRDPEVLAFEVLSAVYSHFQFDATRVPLQRDGRISAEEIRSPHRR
jgi:hypothetical protein